MKFYGLIILRGSNIAEFYLIISLIFGKKKELCAILQSEEHTNSVTITELRDPPTVYNGSDGYEQKSCRSGTNR